MAIGFPGNEEEREKARKRAEFVLKVYEKLGYHALNIGDTDLALGIEYLKALQKDSEIHFLSANLKDKKAGKTIFRPYLIKEVDGLKVAIIGLLTSNGSPHVLKEINGYFIEDPIQAATETAYRLIPHCDYLIALAHLNPSEIESLAQMVPQISIIIGGHDRSFIFPKRIHHSIWVQTNAFGLDIGRLDLKLVKGSSEFVDVLPRNQIQRNIEEIQKKMEDPQYVKEIKNLKEVQEMMLQQKKKMPDIDGKNTYENFLTLLHPGMKSDPEIERLINSSRDQLKRPIPYP